MVISDAIRDLRTRLQKQYAFLKIESRRAEVEKLENISQAPDFWNDVQQAEKTMKMLRQEKSWVKLYDDMQEAIDDLEVALEMAKEGEMEDQEIQTMGTEAVQKMEEFEFQNMLSAEEDSLDAVLQITAGAGGTESNDWAAMLERMYIMWGEKNDYKVKELYKQNGDVAGTKTVTLEISGDHAFGYLKGENGVHRLVRISPFDSGARRHTSFASVYVHPLVDDSIDIEINNSEITWETFRSSGAGGQSVNKIESAVRLRHQPSGIIIENSESRSQLDNKSKALQLLKSRLYELELEKRRAKQKEIESTKKKIEWGSQIRNYVMHPYKLVKDLRTGTETGNVDAVMNGDLNEFLKAYLLQTD